MKKKNENDMPAGKLTRIADFLPPPSKLIRPEETVKITIALKRSSVEFFKAEAQKHHAKYQRMIREVLDRYVSRYEAA